MTNTGDTFDLGIDSLGPGMRIGQGGSAIVYRAHQEELDRDVAVKVLGGAVDDDTRRRFDRERRLMGRLSQHEGMVTVYQTGFTARNEPFIVMPLLGGSLADEIEREPVPWRRAAEIIADVCRTVGFAHDHEIVHRDLKPGNIMMSTSGRPLVADFGIARIVDSKTNLEATALTLTPAYSPPEALETTVADPSTDVYSLGATLFALIVGHAPYCAPGLDRTLMSLMRCIVEDPVPQLGALAPPEIQVVLDRSMAKLPDQRYASALDMADALESALKAVEERATDDTVVAAARGSEAGDRNGTGSNRRHAMVAVVGVVALFVAVAGILVARSDGADDEAASPATDVDTAALPADDAETSDDPDVDGDELVAPVVDPIVMGVATTDAVLVVEGGEVFLLPFDDPGTGTFTGSVAGVVTAELTAFVESAGKGASPDDPNDVVGEPEDPGTAVAGVDGTSDGVFGGTEGVAACAPDQLVDELDPTAPETAAWAEVQAVNVASVPDFIGGLTATVLTADTRITDHRFVDGVAVASQAVLQVGTAVLIDEFGELQVRCSSGSPLSPPAAVQGTTRYVGSPWGTFEPVATVAVVASPDPVEEFVLTNVSGGPDFIRPVGSSGATDRSLLPGDVIATGSIASIPGTDGATFVANEVTITFAPGGGDVIGAYAFTVVVDVITVDSAADLIGTYDPVAGTITGTAVATATVGGGSAEGAGGWTATVDPAAGTIYGLLDGNVGFELTFTPFVI